jgi:hypothetical protein
MNEEAIYIPAEVEIPLSILVCIITIAYICIEFLQMRYLGITEYARDMWNTFDWSFFLLVIGALVVEWRDLWVDADLDIGSEQRLQNKDDFSNMVALSFPFLGLKTLYFLRGFEATGPFIRMVFQVFQDMSTFMLVMLITMGAYFSAFYFIFNGPEEDGYAEFHSKLGMLSMFNMMMGNFDKDIIQKNALSILVFVTYMIFIVIVLLNLLIALMSSSYEKVSSIAEEQTLLEKASIILDVQMFLTKKQREGKWFPKYMDPRSIIQGMYDPRSITGVAIIHENGNERGIQPTPGSTRSGDDRAVQHHLSTKCDADEDHIHHEANH